MARDKFKKWVAEKAKMAESSTRKEKNMTKAEKEKKRKERAARSKRQMGGFFRN